MLVLQVAAAAARVVAMGFNNLPVPVVVLVFWAKAQTALVDNIILTGLAMAVVVVVVELLGVTQAIMEFVVFTVAVLVVLMAAVAAVAHFQVSRVMVVAAQSASSGRAASARSRQLVLETHNLGA